MSLPDPTYDQELINANPVWQRAFELSELHNDNAPIGWSAYIINVLLEGEATPRCEVCHMPEEHCGCDFEAQGLTEATQ